MATKIIYRGCKTCGRRMSIFATEESNILACRCPDCLEDFQEALALKVTI